MSYFLKHREKGVTTYFIAGKKPKITAEDKVFILLMLVMAVYYARRMFLLTPWYDELYTYYYFISRGLAASQQSCGIFDAVCLSGDIWLRACRPAWCILFM